MTLGQPPQKHINTKTGEVCHLLAVSNIGAQHPGFVPTAFYSDEKGTLLSRPLSEFMNKFQKESQQ